MKRRTEVEQKSLLAKVVKLESKMDELDAAEGELVEDVLPRLRLRKTIKAADAARLEALYEKYFGDEDVDEADADKEEEEIDEDDFV